MSRFDTIFKRFGVSTFDRQQAESVTYKITGQADMTWTATVIRGVQTLETGEDGRQFEHVCEVFGKVSSVAATDGPTLAQLEDYRTHSIVIDGREYEALDNTPPETAGGFVTLTVGWMNDLERRKPGSVTTRRQRTSARN